MTLSMSYSGPPSDTNAGSFQGNHNKIDAGTQMASPNDGSSTRINDGIIVIDDGDHNGSPVSSPDPALSNSSTVLVATPSNRSNGGSIVLLSSNKILKHETSRASAFDSQQAAVEPHFRVPDYATRNSHPLHRTSLARSPRSQGRICSTPSSGTLRPPPIRTTRPNTGTVHDPICIGTKSVNSNHNTEAVLMPAPQRDPLGQRPRQSSLASRRLAPLQASTHINIDLDDDSGLEDDTALEGQFFNIPQIQTDQVSTKKTRSGNTGRHLPPRNPDIEPPWSVIKRYSTQSAFGPECDPSRQIHLRKGMIVEVSNGDFVGITMLIRHEATQEVRFRGYKFQRAKEFNGLLERKMNEVVLFLDVDLDDPREPKDQCIKEYSMSDIVRERKLRMTNQKFPLHRLMDPKDLDHEPERMLLDGGLTCRWKYTCTYASAVDRESNRYKEKRFERLRALECTGGLKHNVSDDDIRSQWRGETIPGGSFLPTPASLPSNPEPEAEAISITIEESTLPIRNSSSATSQHPAHHSRGHLCERSNEPCSRAKRRRPSSSGDPASKRLKTAEGAILRGTTNEESVSNEAVEETRRPLSNVSLSNNNDSQAQEDTSMTISEAPISQATSPTIIDLSNEAHHPGQVIDLITSTPSTPEATPQCPKPQQRVHRKPLQAYTYGDAFCGAGGSTRGAVMAGLKVLWGFDSNPNPCQSWRANFPSATCHQMTAHDFVSLAQKPEPISIAEEPINPEPPKEKPCLFKVDILHLSPPCQFFSPAHTVAGRDDDMNIASLFAVQSVIQVCKPRVVTLEQTFGIARGQRFRWFFSALIHMFTCLDFSIRWDTVMLQDWGLPQRRERLIIIASCPGEPLPSMPKPTHGPHPLKDYTSVAEALGEIKPDHATDHNPDTVLHFPLRRKSWDTSSILPRAMTTSGGQNYHYSGIRDFTIREYATLQGFPQGHVFEGGCKKRQVGNAVPPGVARVLFESIGRDLEGVDEVEEGEVVVLD